MDGRVRTWVKGHQVVTFFALAYAIMYAAVFGSLAVDPAHTMAPFTLVWAVAVFSPTIASVVVSWVIGGGAEVRRVLAGFARWRIGVWWYLAAFGLFLAPLMVALVYRVAGGAVPGPQPGVTPLTVVGSVLFTLISGPLSEEAGWRGFALPRLQERFSAVTSSLVLGVVWTCWHIPLFFVAGKASPGIPFFIYLPLVVTLTFYLTWVYNNTGGSLIATTLAHCSFNLDAVLITGALGLLPVMVFYMTAGPGLVLAVVAAVVVFGPKRMSRKAAGELPFRAAAEDPAS